VITRSARFAPVGFAEVPDFHVEVARRDAPGLRGRSVVVGGDPAKRGKVVAASADLRERGIIEGMGVAEALDRARDAQWVKTDIHRAREVSGSLRAAIRQEIDAIEIEGLAGFYMNAPREHEAAIELAERLEARVSERSGLPLRVGIAPARFAARWAAEDAGARGARLIGMDEFDAYLLRQPIERLPGVGPKTAARLRELGAVDIPRLRELGLERLEVLLGNHGRTLFLLACGDDPKALRVRRHPTTFSREETLAGAMPGELRSSLARLAESLERALARDGLCARRLALRLTSTEERVVTRSCSLATAATRSTDLIAAAESLLDRVDLEEDSIRRLGVVLKGLEVSGAKDRQLDLF